MNTYTKEMVIRKLEEYAHEFLEENYGLGLNIPIELNARLTRSLGRFHFTRCGQSVKIDISKGMIEHNEFEFVEGVLKHELIHYALFEKELPFSDGDRHFEQELKKHNAPSNSGYGARSMKKQHVYGCSCGTKFYRDRKDGHQYECRSCEETLQYKNTIEPDKLVRII